MGAVAVGEGGGVGSATEADGGVYLVFSFEGNWLERRAFVGTIAEGRVARESAGAVEVLLARLQLHAAWRLAYFLGQRLAQ